MLIIMIHDDHAPKKKQTWNLHGIPSDAVFRGAGGVREAGEPIHRWPMFARQGEGLFVGPFSTGVTGDVPFGVALL